MKTTRRFLKSKAILNRYFVNIWTVCIGPDGKRLGKPKRRLVKGNGSLQMSILRQLDKMKCPLRIKA